jgi:hypothetical protein
MGHVSFFVSSRIKIHIKIYKSVQKYTVKSVNKGHSKETQNMVFIYKWSLFGGYNGHINQCRVVEEWPLFTGWSLFWGGLTVPNYYFLYL